MRRIPIPAIFGLVMTALFFSMAILAPLIAPYGVGEIVGDVWETPSRAHPLGTDNIGRDLLTRMIYGGQTTILVATLATKDGGVFDAHPDEARDVEEAAVGDAVTLQQPMGEAPVLRVVEGDEVLRRGGARVAVGGEGDG